MRGQTKGTDFRKILGQRACEAKNHSKIVHTNGRKPNKKTIYKYLAVFTEYSVAEYSAGYYLVAIVFAIPEGLGLTN
jgi:hypothetical protein